MAVSSQALADFAPAKVNLTLHVLGRRADGYHEIESLVVFADVGDQLTLTAGDTLALDVTGPTAAAAGEGGDNLVLKAARALGQRVSGLRLGRFSLEKSLPVAAGLGGGSSDAAAALRLLAKLNNLSSDDERVHAAARVTGADVPVCLEPVPRIMRGIGEILSPPVILPGLSAVLINPGVAVPTKDVFAKLAAPLLTTAQTEDDFFDIKADAASILSLLSARRNDLEPPAIALQPAIARVLAALRAAQGCEFARMSGSGATCFGLFTSDSVAEAAAGALAKAHPDWWVMATRFG